MSLPIGRVTFILASLLLAHGTASAVISKQEAIEAVRQFEGVPDLPLTCSDLETSTEGPEWLHEDWYDLKHSDWPEVDSSWSVAAETGEVTSASYPGGGCVEDTDDPVGPFGREECRATAENFARTHYSQFDALNMQPVHDEDWWDRWAWNFQWAGVVDYGALGANNVWVNVSPCDGTVTHYSASRRSSVSPRQPQFTIEQAVDHAMALTEVQTLLWLHGPILYADPDGRVWYRCKELAGVMADSTSRCFFVSFDAETGEMIAKNTRAIGTTPDVAYAPEGSLVWVKLLSVAIRNSRVHWLGKEAKLFIGMNRYTLVPGKDTIEWTGGTIKLSQKMKIVDGRLMVPSDLLDILKSATAPKKALPAQAKSK